MALIDFAALTAPVSETESCGPDLDLEGDPDYMNYVARAEGILPATFFSRDAEGRQTPFDRTTIDFDAEFRALGKLLDATRDLRLLTLVAKFSILNRDLASFASTIKVMAGLVAQNWHDVHPRGDDGDFTLRMVSLQTLDDSPTVILPLQHAPLVQSRRFGLISYRNLMVAQGEANARDGEDAPDSASIESAFREADLGTLVATRDQVDVIKTSLATIHATWLEKAGYDQAVAFAKLSPLVDKILAALDGAVAKRSPAAALASQPATDPSGATPPGGIGLPAQSAAATARVQSVKDAAAALAAAGEYFARSEPSSPALLLVRQAQYLIGKSFHEVIQTLLPAHAEHASIRLGADQIFELPVERLSGVILEPNASSSSEDTGLEQPESLSEEGIATESQPNGEVSPIEAAGANGGSRPDSSIPGASTRYEAIALLEQVSAFYRTTEPASPIPLLTDRACGMSQKDFLSLLKDVLPGVGVTQEY
jgi:type VI secretion system protein ImpA